MYQMNLPSSMARMTNTPMYNRSMCGSRGTVGIESFQGNNGQVNGKDGRFDLEKEVLAANGEARLAVDYINQIKPFVYDKAVEDDESGTKALNKLHQPIE